VELRELRTFVAVVEAGGLSAAARRLHVSQPALSQTVRALERELGVQLLVRSSTGAVPTEAGRALLPEARAVLAQTDQLVDRVSGRGGAAGAGGVLRLGVPLELHPDLLPPAVEALRAEWPDVRLQPRHASSAAQLAALRAGELDVALVRELPSGEQVDAVPVLSEPLGVLLATHALPGGPCDTGPVRLEQLAGRPWVSFARQEAPAWWDEISAVLRRHGHDAPVDPGAAVPLLAQVRLVAVADGSAFALAPAQWWQPLPASVQWRPLAGEPLVRRTWAVWPAGSRRRDLATLVDALQDHLDRPTGGAGPVADG